MDKEIQQAIELLQRHGYEVVMPQSVTEINEEFEYWWQLYNKNRGKEKCAKRWARLSKKDRQACIAATPAYVQSVSNKQYQKDPLTYLNGHCWQDEIIDPYGERKQAIAFATKTADILSAE